MSYSHLKIFFFKQMSYSQTSSGRIGRLKKKNLPQGRLKKKKFFFFFNRGRFKRHIPVSPKNYSSLKLQMK